ncbi:MAG: DNA polymerase III subunit delta [Planctomycetes bacterium RBG_13_46_10]|nr:MAG: DNA polymerase III subunit delta [Planctomycetes bacterium RBG_13_46_10]
MRELIYVISGKDDSLVNTECAKLLDRLLEPQQRVTGLFTAEAGISACEVLDELRTTPFLTDKRVVVVKNADEFISDNRPILEKYFDNPCNTGILILTVSGWQANTKLAKKLPKIGKLISVAEPKPEQLPRLLVEYAKNTCDKKMSTDTAVLLVELVGDELTRLYGEIDKLAVFACDEKVITVNQVESLIGHSRIFGAFAVIDAIIAGRTSQAVARLRNMFAEEKNADYTVVGAFAFHFRRMFGAKAMLEKGVKPGDVAKKLRIWSNQEGFFSQLRNISLKQIGSVLRQLADIDFKIKTGQTRAEVAIEQLVLSLSSA